MNEIFEMQNRVIQNYGFEDPITIELFAMCARGETVKNIRGFLGMWEALEPMWVDAA